MPQSLSVVDIHIVFSTKNREPLIARDHEAALWAYVAGICRNHECVPHAVGGMPDHIHIACSLHRTVTQSDLVKEIKIGATKWMKAETGWPFAWQRGYGVFSFGPAQKLEVIAYIQNQREHHRVRTFKEEFVAFLERHGVEYDPQYVWD
jgi:putative transposase